MSTLHAIGVVLSPGATCVSEVNKRGGEGYFTVRFSQAKQTNGSNEHFSTHCSDFINTNQFTGSKDMLSKQIDFFCCYAHPLKGFGHCQQDLSLARECTICLPALIPTCLWGSLLAWLHSWSPHGRSQRKPSSHRRWPRTGVGDRAHPVPWEHRDRRGAVTAPGLTAKPRIAWSVCRGCPSSPGGYHTFLSCLQNAVTTNCRKQPHPHLIRVKPAQLCTTSPACPVLCVLLQAYSYSQTCFHLLLLDVFFPLQTSWPVKMAGDHCSQRACCHSYWPWHCLLPWADVAFPCTDGCSKAEGVRESLLCSS